MRLSQRSEQMIEILLYCGKAHGSWVLSSGAADAVPMSRIYAAKIINSLSNGGFIETRRGRQGGIRLARAPQAISLGSVIRLADDGPFYRSVRTVGDKPIAHIVRSAAVTLGEIFDAFTLADLLDGDTIPAVIAARLAHRTCPLAAARLAPPEDFRGSRRPADTDAVFGHLN